MRDAIRQIGKRLLLALAMFAVAGSVALAAGPELNLDRVGLAIRGFDPVAYFVEGKPVAGRNEIVATHAGATYRFASAANRDAFVAAPEKYLPQYGGYCAYAAALGKKADGDPQVWRIVGGRLYLNFNRSIGERWSADEKGFIAKGDANWPRIRDKAAAELN